MKNRNSISILTLCNDNESMLKLSLENALLNSGYDVSIFVLNKTENNSTNESIKSFCENNKMHFFSTNKKDVTYSGCINTLFEFEKKEVSSDFVCILPVNSLVNYLWLENMIQVYTEYKDVGILSVRSGTEKLSFCEVLKKETVSQECLTSNFLFSNINCVEGILFFSKNVLCKVGVFNDVDMLSGFEQKEFCLRASMLGYKNFYVRNSIAMSVPIENSFLFPEKKQISWDIFKIKIETLAKEANESIETDVIFNM